MVISLDRLNQEIERENIKKPRADQVTAPQNGAVFISKDSGLSNPNSKSPAAATAPAATYATIEQQAKITRRIDDFSAKVQSAGLETDAAQDVVAAYADMARTEDRQSTIKLETTVKRAAEQKAEIDADLNVAKLEIEASLEAPYAALQSATAETVEAAQARYNRAVRIAQAKLDAARVKAKNKAATINDSIVEAAENLRQNTVQKQQQSDTMQASESVVGNEGGGNVNGLLKQSTCSPDDFYKYLNKINRDYADTYVKTGKWPSDIQIPKSPDVFKADGTINWDEVPNGGYVLDGKGDAIKEQYVPSIGETIDRYGPNNGRFSSPIRNNKPYNYAQRSLPYLENPSQYHLYKVTGDLSNIEQYFNQSTDVNLKQMISAYMNKFKLSFSDLETYRGEIASGFGEIGGGEQYELPLPVNMLEGLGLLKEFKLGGQHD